MATHGLHPYPAKFIPQIPRVLIETLSAPGEWVADIFCGSGTTLVESMLSGRNAIGIDANPVACLMSTAKTSKLSTKQMNQLRCLAANSFEMAAKKGGSNLDIFSGSKYFTSGAKRPDDEALNFWFKPFVVEELAEILSWCNGIEDAACRTIVRTVLSSIVVTVSNQDSDTRYVRREKNQKPGVTFKRFGKALEFSIDAMRRFTGAVPANVTCEVYHEDLLRFSKHLSIDLLVCSPPYPNAFSYHLYHMTRMLWLGLDHLAFKEIEIGSHRKYSAKGKNAATVATFASELRIILGWLRKCIKPGRYACFVLGDSIIRGELIDNADIVSRVASEFGFVEVARIPRTLQSTKKSFNPKIGRIKVEKILILQAPRGR